MPRVSPFSMVNEMSLTADTSPSMVLKRVLSLLTVSRDMSGLAIFFDFYQLLSVFRIQRIAQAITDKVETEQRGGKKDGGEQ